MNERSGVAAEDHKYKAPEQIFRMKTRVVSLKLVGFGGPCLFTAVEHVLDEIRILLTADDKVGGAIAMDHGEQIVLTIGTMTLQEIDNLPEFQGY